MSKTTDDILNKAKRLSTTERAELAVGLLASLDGEPKGDVETAWAAEIERRVERVRSGEALKDDNSPFKVESIDPSQGKNLLREFRLSE